MAAANESSTVPPQAKADARPYIGGQAVLEGVMMRSPTSFAIVVRRKDGTLVVRERPIHDDRRGARRLPFVRGVASLVESLRLGSEALRFSADQMEKDLEAGELEQAKKSAKQAKGAGKSALGVFGALGLSLFYALTSEGQGASRPATEGKSRGSFGVMMLLAVLVLVALPQAATAGLNRWLHLGLEVQSPPFQIVTGAFKLAIVVGYMLLIRRMHYIRRVFQYHGAEHKTISTYEADEPLVVANARKKTTLHPRCGTTFLVMVAIVSILVFTAVGGLLPRIQTGNTLLDNVIFFAEKLPFLPVIAAVTFELQRFFARYCTTGPLRVLLWPGFLVQKITTIEPDDQQLEVALASLRATLFRERGEKADSHEDVRFESFDALMRAERLRPKHAA